MSALIQAMRFGKAQGWLSSSYLLPPVPVVVVAGACAGFFVAGADGLAVAVTGCLSEVLVTPAAGAG
jgi:hypothetical protein